MTSPLLEPVQAALATVNDPEIKRPITELGMVSQVDIADAGSVSVTILLTVSACPMKDTLRRDVTAAVASVAGVTGVSVILDVMSAEQRQELQQEETDGLRLLRDQLSGVRLRPTARRRAKTALDARQRARHFAPASVEQSRAHA